MKRRAGLGKWLATVAIAMMGAGTSAQEWSMQNPIVEDSIPTFRAVWGSGLFCAFVVGDSGTISYYDGLSWSAMTSGTTQGLAGVWGSRPDDVFAVGTAGTIFHYDGSAWSAKVSGTTQSLISVWGTGPNEVLAVGDVGTILRYDGSSWSTMTSGTTNALRGIAGISPNDVFAVGDGGVILHCDGVAWSTVVSPTTVSLKSIWVADSNNMFVVGAGGTILRYDGSSWSTMTSGTTATLQGVWGTGPNDVLAVGSGGCVIHYDGTAWTPVTSGITAGLYGIWASTSQDIYAVGDSGTILRWNGSTWWTANRPPLASPTVADLQDIWGSGPNDVFAVGGGVIVHYDGDQWSLMDSPNSVGAIWGSAPNNVYAVGAGGTVLHYDGSVWSAIESGSTADFADVWCNGPNNVFVTDNYSVIRRYNGSSWSTPAGALNGVFGFSTGEVFTTGVSYAALMYYVRLYRFDGSGFVQVASWNAGVSPVTLSSIVGSSPQDLYVVGGTSTGPLLLRYDGSSFSKIPSLAPLVSVYSCAWANSPNDVWVSENVGYRVWHSNGESWTTMRTGFGGYRYIRRIWGSGPNDVFAVGLKGLIAHYPAQTRYRLKLTIPNRPWGDVAVEPNRLNYDPNTTVTLTAEPTNGGTFVRWQGDVPTGHEQDNPLTLQMDSTKTVTALFRGPSLTLSVVHDTWGTVTVDPNQPFYRSGQWVTLTATPIEGKAFGGWTIYDPCFPGDAGHAIIDDNMVTSVQLNADTQVEAAFKCGSGLGMLPAPAALGLLGLVLLRRRG